MSRSQSTPKPGRARLRAWRCLICVKLTDIVQVSYEYTFDEGSAWT
jgi:hypothetical protein